MKWFRWAMVIYSAVAAIGHASRAQAELDGPPRKLSETFAVRVGPLQVAAHPSLEACEADARARTANPGAAIRSFQARTGGGTIYATPSTQDACVKAVINRLTANAATKTSGSEVNSCWAMTKYSTAFQPPTCLAIYNYVAKYRAPTTTTPPPTCPAPPAPQTKTNACPSGTTGSWTQTGTTSFGPAPACEPTVTWEPSSPPSSQCVPLPPTGCVGRTCTFGWDEYADARAEGFRCHYGTSRTALVGTVQVNGGTVRRCSITFPQAGTWYAAVLAFGGGNSSSLSNIQTVTVP